MIEMMIGMALAKDKSLGQLQTHDLMLVPQVNDLAATPKIREFVPKGEWREEGLGHYDPLSIWNVNENNEGEFSQQSARHNLSHRWYDLADGFIFS